MVEGQIQMKITPQRIKDILLITPDIFEDKRGFFLETARASVLRGAGIPELVQHNHSRSELGVLRGLHYQLNNPQGKLVRCSKGRVFDVAVDIRKNSPTFGQSLGFILDDIKHLQVWIPPGFAHGFLVLSKTADFLYLCSNYYTPGDEHGIYWDDKTLGIDWPKLPNGISLKLSDRDKSHPLLSNQSNKYLF